MGPGELFLEAVRLGGEEARSRLVEAVAAVGVEEALEQVRRRVGGEAFPDTVVARTAVEAVLAAVAVAERRLRVLAPRDPVRGWGPLMSLLDTLSRRGLVEVYTVPMEPGPRLHARELARRAAKIARGLAARIVDVTDAPPFVVAGLYGAGVRSLTVLVDAGYAAVFQRFGYT